MFITFTLPSGYSSTDAGPFNISGVTDTSTVVLLASGITKSQLLTGYTVDTTPYTIVSGTVASVGVCTNEVTFEISVPTPTPTLTVTPTYSQTITPTRTPTRTPTLTPTYSQTVTPTIESVVTPTPTLTVTPDSVPDADAMLYFEGRVCDTIITNWTTKTPEEVKCDWEYIITHPNWYYSGSGIHYYSSAGFVPGTQLYGASPSYIPSVFTGNYVHTPNGENTYPIYVVEIVNGVINSVTDFATLPTCGTYECPTPTPTITPTTSQTVTPTISQTVTPTYSQTITPTVTPTLTPTLTRTPTLTPEEIGTVGYLADEFTCDYDPDTGESIQCNLVASSVEVRFPTSYTPSYNRYYAPNPGGCSGSVYFITGNSTNNTGPIIAGTTPYINCSGPISACLEECPL
jgi:hypothetical protein